MRRAAHPVQPMQVVGQHARGEKGLGKRGQGFRVVVDAAQQHALIEQHGPGPGQPFHGPGHRPVDFMGMVGVNHHHRFERGFPGQSGKPAHEAVVHPGGQHHGQPGVDAQPLQVGDRRQISSH